ncbi:MULTISPECIES: ABC transporter substrate-binding protein [unclassified Aeromicrobium]|uniref:ABC transporter substrate-binding protein n=1 Tax=unclassified Aeromicrobium TaxID=2633570 RepID=UPI00396B36A2
MAAAIVVMGLGLAACGSDSEGSSSGEIVIATDMPLSGGGTSTCKPIADGSAAWFEKVNAEGGVHGKKIKNIVEDDALNPSEAITNVRGFVADDSVVALFSGCGSAVTQAVLPVLKGSDLAYFFPWAQAPGLAAEPNVFMLQPEWDEQAGPAIADVLDRFGSGSVYYIGQAIPGIEEDIKNVQKDVEAAGGEFVGSSVVKINETDVTSTILKIKSLKPDYVVSVITSGDQARVVKAMDAQSAFPQKYLLTSGTAATDAFLSGIGDVPIDGKTLAFSVTAAPASDQGKECVEAFKKYAPGLIADAQSLIGCTNAQAMIAALEDAGKNPTRASVSKAVEAWSEKKVSEALPPVTFSGDDHQGIHSLFVLGFDGGKIIPSFEVELPSP